MDTLVRDTPAPATEARFGHEGDPGAPAPGTPVAAPRACERCGAEMAPGQDWCLDCGTAAPGRLGRRPGMRAATTVVALTLALVAGAVTAGYAAINGDAGRDVSKPPAASGAPIAQAPPSTPAAPAPTAVAPQTPAAPLPTVKPPVGSTSAAPPAAAHPAAPAPAAPAPAAPTHTTPATTTPAHTNTGSSTPPAATAPQPIDLGADAASLYDPYTRMTSNGDPADSYDGDSTTAWKVSSTPDGQDMQVGLLVDLSKKREIKQLALKTSTPGFRIELYATDTAQVPPDVLDTRWAHLRTQGDVARSSTLGLASDSHKYRYVLLWFTTPPKKSPTVKINEFTILG